MNTPIFMTSSGRLADNWREAFPDAELMLGPGDRVSVHYLQQAPALLFVDYLGLNGAQKKSWLDHALTLNVRAIVLSPVPDGDEALNVIKRGALGYGHTLASAPRLREMAMVVSHGGLWAGKQFMQRIMQAVAQANSEVTNLKPTMPNLEHVKSLLNERELSIARYVAIGATNQEISAYLAMAERTVKSHITSMFNKLQVRNRVELALTLNNIPLTPVDPAASRRHAL